MLTTLLWSQCPVESPESWRVHTMTRSSLSPTSKYSAPITLEPSIMNATNGDMTRQKARFSTVLFLCDIMRRRMKTVFGNKWFYQCRSLLFQFGSSEAVRWNMLKRYREDTKDYLYNKLRITLVDPDACPCKSRGQKKIHHVFETQEIQQRTTYATPTARPCRSGSQISSHDSLGRLGMVIPGILLMLP